MLSQTTIDHWFYIAYKIAHQHHGLTGDNPHVGALLCNDTELLVSARTQQKGYPHAEQELRNIYPKPWHHDHMFITLEPCNKKGRSESCLDIILEKKPASIGIGLLDPNPDIHAQSIAILQQHYAYVYRPSSSIRLLIAEQLAGFASRMQRNKPLVILKTATSLDGSIALGRGHNPWITNAQALRHVHHQRFHVNAILSTAKTIIQDNARLTCRIKGKDSKKITRIIIDKYNQLHKDLLLFADIDHNPVIILTADKRHHPLYNSHPHIDYCDVPLQKNGYMDLDEILHMMATIYKINELMVEAGQTLLTQFIQEHLYDKLYHYQAPMLLGADSHKMVGNLSQQDITYEHNLIKYDEQFFVDGNYFVEYHTKNYHNFIESLID